MGGNSLKNWSMDTHFVNNLNRFIQTYFEADLTDDLVIMYKMCKDIEQAASPKLKDTKEEYKDIHWISQNLNKIFVIDKETGKIRGVHTENYTIVRAKLDETFRKLLHKLEAENIYTHEIQDPGKALGNGYK